MIERRAAADEAEHGLRLVVHDGHASLVFDSPASRVNLLTTAALGSFSTLLERLEAEARSGSLKALVIRSAKPDNFIAGADINEFARFETAEQAETISRQGQELFSRLENLPVTTLAAINGTCLGGGLELSLSCDFRVASDHPKTRLGLPETRLGILPGLGGTVRLPRLIGLRRALDMILTASQLPASKALAFGLVDRVIDSQEFEGEVDAIAKAFAEGRIPLKARSLPLALRLENSAPVRAIIHRFALKGIAARTKGHYPALPRAVDVTVRGLGLNRQRAHEAEAAAFGELAVTMVSKNLISIFHLTESAKKRKPAAEPSPVARAAVIGAGVMGAGIAELFAYQSVPVRLVDVNEDLVYSGVERATDLLRKAAAKGGWDNEELIEKVDCLEGTTSYDGFERVDAVIEAIVEKAEIKRTVFAKLEERLQPTALIASNTSALSISELASGLQHPGRVCGLHFFNPPHRMPLVEVVRGSSTSDQALATAFVVALRLGKTPVIVNDSPGFVVNRILAAYLTEAGYILQEGMGVRELDRLMTEFGMPMGPLRLLDEVGLDVIASVSETMERGLGERFKPAAVMEQVLATGVTGKKGGRGFYVYQNGKRGNVNPELAAVIAKASGRQAPSPGDAGERMVYTMVNEAARTLDDEIVATPDDIDIAMIMGAGFPPFRGGLLRYADAIGLGEIAARLERLAREHGQRLLPAPGLTERSSFYG